MILQALLRMRTRRFIAVSIFAVALASVLAACGGGEAKTEVPANAIAVVGDEVVPRSEYDRLLTQAKKQYTDAGRKFPAVGSSGYEGIKNQIVAYLVRNAAIDEEAAQMGVKITDAEVDASLNQLIEQRFEGDRAKYRNELKKENMTEQQLKDGLRQQLIGQRVQTMLVERVEVSDDEIEKYYNEHKSSYRQAESRMASHILVKTKAKAEELYRQLQNGAKFATLAKKNSQDPGSKTSGGALGNVEKGKMVAEFEKALFKLDNGELSRPVKSSFGWHLILAQSATKPARMQTLKEATATIEQTLQQQKQSEAVSNWVKEADEYASNHTTYAPEFKPPKDTASTVGTTTTP